MLRDALLHKCANRGSGGGGPLVWDDFSGRTGEISGTAPSQIVPAGETWLDVAPANGGYGNINAAGYVYSTAATRRVERIYCGQNDVMVVCTVLCTSAGFYGEAGVMLRGDADLVTGVTTIPATCLWAHVSNRYNRLYAYERNDDYNTQALSMDTVDDVPENQLYRFAVVCVGDKLRIFREGYESNYHELTITNMEKQGGTGYIAICPTDLVRFYDVKVYPATSIDMTIPV